MKTHLLSRFAMLLSVVLIALAAPSRPSLQAAPQAVGPSQTPDVSGEVVYKGTTPLPDTYVQITPVISGAPDYSQTQYTFTDIDGLFFFA
ncbi:MAG TPA: hypothetical protein VFX76_18800, partial [Roseiflexaceae bacterium]|nr:hypothetical protein [Roseiflexaceae bacterium]